MLNIAWSGDGSVRWLLERGGATRSADGEPLRMLGIVQDITERKQAAKSLTESEELFREFAENTEEVFWVRDLRSNRMIYVSPAYESIWGRSCTTLLANPLDFLDAVHPDDLNSVREGVLHQQRGEYFNRDYRIIRTDGQIRWVHVHTFPIRNNAGVVYRIGGLARDITRQQEMETDRIRHERAQVQTLVREVHHRIKNHLQGVGLLDEHASRFPAAASFGQAIINPLHRPGAWTSGAWHGCGIAPVRNCPGRGAIGRSNTGCIDVCRDTD
jgi:PAS domain S-box-containing protein